MTLMRRVYAKIIILFVLVCSHSYCIAIGVYRLPPFSQIQLAKRFPLRDRGIVIYDSYYYYYYLQRKSLFMKLSGQKSIVMVGDSITNGCEWNELFSRNDIANRGIVGDTTAGVLNRIDSILKIQPRKVFLMIGTNDISGQWSIDAIVENYKEIILKLKSSTDVFVQSTLFVGRNQIEKNTKVRTLNEKIKSFCQQNNVTYIDLNSVLAPKGYLDPNYSNDGLHLIGEGYSVLKREIEKYF